MTDMYRVTEIKEGEAGLPAALAWLKGGQIVTCNDVVEGCAKRGMDISHKAVRCAVSKACKNGSLKDTKDWAAGLETVTEWQGSLGSTKITNQNPGKRGTRYTYLRALGKFNSWLAGKKFDVSTYVDEDVVQKRVGFQNVEDILRYLAGPAERNRHTVMIIKKYLHDPLHKGKKASTVKTEKNAIMSYLTYHDFDIYVKFDAKKIYNSTMPYKEFTLSDMQMMLQTANRRDRAILACKFHRGLDLSTLTDVFNHEAFGQISDHYNTTDHTQWDPAKCPVPIKLRRVKTGYVHTGFIDVDALNAVISHLNEMAKSGKKFGRGLPLFVTKRNTAISNNAVIHIFEKTARKAGLRDGPAMVSSHEVRDLLKSTLISSGCRYDVADHVIGHKPKDSYEKQALLYPETIRSEYAKASRMINVMTHSQAAVNGNPDGDARLEKMAGMAHELMYRIRNCEQDKSDLKHARTKIAKLKDRLNASHRISKELLERIDILHGTIRQLSESGAHMHEPWPDYDQHANKPAQKSCKVRISESA